MASNLSFFLCILSLFFIYATHAATHHHAAAPAPSVDCSSLVLNMADCLSYVSNGSTATKPEGTCCSGLKTVLKTDAECLCEAFKSSAQLGVVLNVTKALTLPAACKLHAPSASNCGLSLAPTAAPGVTPPSIATAPGTNSGLNVQAPAPSPGASSSHGISISVGSLAIGFVIAAFSSF
ncbi:hypothetical protein P3X46_022243 [Hevea brasiliensis]|uniref:Bifunctional inhibitor/plant lipid transfer protein/seed storage helical domain-containing protein n=1 Tax=Hevea brasiliensis TaxID=3981 RepID=A0ABQ9L913_HEVBR|nr:non-specific lipid transfer protein GPI-anchored 31 [Hevea brasiliensis]KAJ9162474.1 hypothetical protein P3X46_022243 [Hevea brasiliensis]